MQETEFEYNKKKKWYKNKLVIFILILVCIFVVFNIWKTKTQENNLTNSKYLQIITYDDSFGWLFGKRIEHVLREHPLLGKVITLNKPLIYNQDCGKYCWSSPIESQINRGLECPYGNTPARVYKNNFKNVSYIPINMQFTVIKVMEHKATGMLVIGGQSPMSIVLKDENGILSTATLSDYEKSGIFTCSTDNTPRHMDKLFAYTENYRSANILVTLNDYSSTTPEIFIKELPISTMPLSNPDFSKYQFSNIKTLNNSNSADPQITMNVNSDTLAFLVASRLDLNIFNIIGIDADYVKMLTPEEKTENF